MPFEDLASVGALSDENDELLEEVQRLREQNAELQRRAAAPSSVTGSGAAEARAAHEAEYKARAAAANTEAEMRGVVEWHQTKVAELAGNAPVPMRPMTDDEVRARHKQKLAELDAIGDFSLNGTIEAGRAADEAEQRYQEDVNRGVPIR